MHMKKSKYPKFVKQGFKPTSKTNSLNTKGCFFVVQLQQEGITHST